MLIPGGGPINVSAIRPGSRRVLTRGRIGCRADPEPGGATKPKEVPGVRQVEKLPGGLQPSADPGGPLRQVFLEIRRAQCEDTTYLR